MNKRKVNQSTIIRRKGLLLSALACVSVVSVILAAVSGSFVCYAVSYDGEVVGTVSSRSELDSAIEEADAVAEDILGEDHPVIDNLAVTTTISSGAGSADSLTGALLDSIEGIEYHPFLMVDGKAVAATENEQTIYDVLNGILARYSNEGTVSAVTAQDVRVENGYVSSDLMTDAAGLAELLDPENADSPCALTVITRKESTSVETIPYNEIVSYDSLAYSDEVIVNQEGIEGRSLDTIVTVFENGKEVASFVSSSEVISTPVDREITVGTIPGSRTDSTGTYIWPTTGIITSKFGYRNITVASTNHRGIDIGNSVGTDVWAADGGTVIYAQDTEGSYGKLVKIQHDDGAVTYYAHLSKILVGVGDKVAQGEIIAKMGKTGRVTGSHLHFEICPDGKTPVDPTRYLSGKPERN